MQLGVHLGHRTVSPQVTVANHVAAVAVAFEVQATRTDRGKRDRNETGQRSRARDVQRAVGLGVREQRSDRAAHGLERPRRRPGVGLENVKADIARLEEHISDQQAPAAHKVGASQARKKEVDQMGSRTDGRRA